MTRNWFVAVPLLCASAGALACPLCVGAYQSSRADCAIMKSDLRQQHPSRLAIVAYLRQGPGAGTLGVDLTQSASATRSATTIPVLPQ